MAKYKPALDMPESIKAKRLLWRPSHTWLASSVLVSVIAILSISELSEFIYFQF
ncbi:MAG: hypothetical protein ACOY9D_11805 [Pseudomonadota bacterium]